MMRVFITSLVDSLLLLKTSDFPLTIAFLYGLYKLFPGKDGSD